MFSVAAVLLAMGSLVVAVPQTPAAAAVVTGPVPLTPDNAAIGQPCVISWTPDTSGKWKQTNIELMTGQNQKMVHVTTVTTVDTTAAGATSFTWTCPDVDTTSTIYWYQFSYAGEPNNLQWTTRFAITGANGEITTPQYATQPDGSAVPWGIGAYVDPTQTKPAPTYITGEISSPAVARAGTNGTTTGAAVATTTPAAATGVFLTSSSPSATVKKNTTASASAAVSTASSGALPKNAVSALSVGLVGAVVALFVGA